RSFRTDAGIHYDGRFVIRWEHDWVSFRLESPGFLPSEEFDISWQGRDDLHVVMKPAPQLTVEVKDAGGRPIPQVYVIPVNGRSPEGEEISDFELSDGRPRPTDALGRASFRSLMPGDYEILCRWTTSE